MRDGDGRRPHGPFIAVVGPSGAGKDTILALARPQFGPDTHFARRVITRISQVEAEDHDSLDETAFDAAERAGAFCLSWAAHGLRYGLPAALVAHCEAGRAVVANVSRRALTSAAGRFSPLHVVEITAPRALLIQRIAARGRESAEEIEARLARSAPLEMPDGAHGPHRIDNSARAEDAAADFIRLVRSLVAEASAAA